jgi:hypothetical protein
MRIYFKLLGAHYHCRVFFNGKCGDLCVGEKEWAEFQACFSSFTQWFNETSS